MYIENIYRQYGRQVNCKYIVATNSFMCVITIFRAIDC